ncbi:hypothetical protein HYV70_02275 [Candidatus Uhrbacteria bacterium]|nr:hypothetical protein [Candidatus Uhrbacteria bacterium]
MKYILAICDSHSSLSGALSLVDGRSEIIYQINAQEICQIKTLDRLDVYDLIVLGGIDWRIRATSFSLARHFRARFDGPMIAVSNIVGWCVKMREAGCTQALPDNRETAQLIHDLLFPPLP